MRYLTTTLPGRVACVTSFLLAWCLLAAVLTGNWLALLVLSTPLMAVLTAVLVAAGGFCAAMVVWAWVELTTDYDPGPAFVPARPQPVPVRSLTRPPVEVWGVLASAS